MKDRLRINPEVLEEINSFLTEKEEEGEEDNPVIDRVVELVEKYGGAKRINELAEENGKLEVLMEKLQHKKPEYAGQVRWLMDQRDNKKFVTMEDYRKKCGAKDLLDDSYSVTLEISSLHYFPWLIAEAKRAIEREELMPARYIRVRYMKEQEEDGDLLATTAAMKILGATWVESLDTKGTDGSNIHLGGPETITGYFGGVGEPNDYVYRWIDEYLYYHTNYGIRQVLNLNAGTVLAAYILYKLGVDIEFKLSVFTGADNPLNVLYVLMMAKLFSRDDGTTPLVGLNLSNSVNNETISLSSFIRKAFGFEERVRIEHHIVEAYKHIVKQPYDRLAELVEISKSVKNISAKHEGGVPEIESKREHPSDILDYFMNKQDIIDMGLMPHLEQNYLDKHDAVQRTARELLRNGIPVLAAPELH